MIHMNVLVQVLSITLVHGTKEVPKRLCTSVRLAQFAETNSNTMVYGTHLKQGVSVVPHLEDGVGQDDDTAHGVGAEDLREHQDDLLHQGGVDQREDRPLRPVGHEPTHGHLCIQENDRHGKTKDQEKRQGNRGGTSRCEKTKHM